MDLHIRHFIGRKKLLKDEQLNLHVEEDGIRRASCATCFYMVLGEDTLHAGKLQWPPTCSFRSASSSFLFATVFLVTSSKVAHFFCRAIWFSSNWWLSSFRKSLSSAVFASDEVIAACVGSEVTLRVPALF